MTETFKIHDALAAGGVKNLTEAERQSLLAELRKPPALPPIDVSKMARDMTEQEKQAWMANLRRQYQ
jgi:hypothetical protein